MTVGSDVLLGGGVAGWALLLIVIGFYLFMKGNRQ